MTDRQDGRRVAGGAGFDWAARPAPVLLWTAEPGGACTFVGAAWLGFTGQPLEEAVGAGWWQVVHPDDRPRRMLAHQEAAAVSEPFEVEYRLWRRDGSWRWVLERGIPVSGPGRPTGFVGAVLDIAERRPAERALLESREELRLALDAGHMGTWVWDRRSGKVTRDRNLQELYGLPPEPSAGSFEEWVAIVHPDDRAWVVGEVERAVAEGGVYELEHRVIRPDGEVRWLERRGQVYFDEHGEVAGTRGLVIDITERKRAEEERARLLAAEQVARRQAERAANRVARLQAITAGLADARTAEEVAAVVVGQGVAGLEAHSAALCLLTPDGTQLRIVRHRGFEPGSIERFQTFAVDDPLPVAEAVRRGELVLLASLDDRDQRYPALRGSPALNESLAALPLFIDGRPVGAIAVGWESARFFDEEDRAFLMTLGHQAAQALDRAQFHEAERRRSRQQAFLAEASRLLGSSLDHEAAVAGVVRLAVPAVADSCSVHLVEDGGLRTVAERHAEGGTSRPSGRPWGMSTAQLLEVVAGSEALVVPRVEDHLAAWAEDEDHLAALTALGRRSAMAVPLRSGDQTLGVVTLATRSPDRPYGPDDLAFVEDLAARVAAAVANGRAHQTRTEIAHTLQQSLLPPDVPLLPGVEVAARYRPIGPDIEVGGDFYDVFPAGGERWGVAIGDVSGKGIPASSLTALARYTLRAASRRESDPSAVLHALNGTILDDGADDERFCTVALGFLQHRDDGLTLTMSCGGHLLPVLVRADGTLERLGQPGTALGLFGDPVLSDRTDVLGPGDAVVLYTDGVEEARAPDGTFADGLLERTLASHAGRPAEDMARAVEESVLAFGGGRQRDDLAIVVVRRPPEVFSVRVRPGPEAVSLARRHLQAWLVERLPCEEDLAEEVVLVANELVTNAARAARSAAGLHVAVNPDAVVVDVADDGPGASLLMPPAVPPPTEGTGGRGLHIVGRLGHQREVRSTSYGTLVRWVGRRQPAGG
ncbi:MAG: SpoIIE family protein phosphatase [Acidimicrobiales bacterium]